MNLVISRIWIWNQKRKPNQTLFHHQQNPIICFRNPEAKRELQSKVQPDSLIRDRAKHQSEFGKYESNGGNERKESRI